MSGRNAMLAALDAALASVAVELAQVSDPDSLKPNPLAWVNKRVADSVSRELCLPGLLVALGERKTAQKRPYRASVAAVPTGKTGMLLRVISSNEGITMTGIAAAMISDLDAESTRVLTRRLIKSGHVSRRRNEAGKWGYFAVEGRS